MTRELIEKAIVGSIKIPAYEWGDSAKAVKKAFLKGDFSKAIGAADKLGAKEEIGNEIAGMLREMVAGRVANFEKHLEAGNVHQAFEGAKALAKGVKGLPEEDRLEALLTKISKDKNLKKALGTQQKLADLTATEVRKKKECADVIKKMEKLMKGNEGTRTGDLIDAAIKDLRTKMGKMKR